MKFSRYAATAAIVLMAAAPAVSAQSTADRAGMSRQNLLSSNPIGMLFEWYNGEYERGLNSTVSLAAAGTSYDFDDVRYTSLDGIGRYYPAGRALRGFSIGLSLGIVDIRDEVEGCDFCEDDSGTAATIGVRGDYVWILGRDQRFTVATGVGAKRLLGNDIGTEGLPIGRLSIGYAW
jgi:hypothetical protein